MSASTLNAGSPPALEIVRITQMGGSLDTHLTPSFQSAMKYLYRRLFDLSGDRMRIADPFARNCGIAGKHTNDIDPETNAVHHLDAVDFLCSLPSGEFDAVIFDPPFSSNQAERYPIGDLNIYTKPGYIKECMGEVNRILRPGGYLLKFGYNTSRCHQFDMVKIWIVNSGGNHNDTLISLQRKGNYTLDLWTV